MSKVNFRMALHSTNEIETDDLTKVERQDEIRKFNVQYYTKIMSKVLIFSTMIHRI